MKKTAFRLASIFIALVMVLVILGPAAVLAEGGDGQQSNISTQASTNHGHGLGLKLPLNEEKEYSNKYALKVDKVLPNATAIARANAERKEESLPLLPASLAVPDSKTLLSGTSSNKPGVAATDREVLTDASNYGVLAKSVDNSGLNYFPAIGDQGEQNSCVAFATTYYMLTYQNAKARNLDAKHNTAYVFSPKFTYNLVNGGKDNGATFDDSYFAMYDSGSLPESQFPYDPNDPLNPHNPLHYTAWPTDANIWRNAMKYRTAPVAGNDIYWGYIGDLNTDTGLNNMKQQLANGNILNIGINYFNSNLKMLPVKDNSSTSTDNPFVGQAAIAYMNHNDGYSGHALTIVGYNDDIWIDGNQNGTRTNEDELGAFKAVNSWGTGWPADQGIPGVTNSSPGTIWISYKAFKTGTTGVGIASNNVAFFINARSTEYVPILTANVTVTTNDRYGLTAFYGLNWAEGTEPIEDHSFDSESPRNPPFDSNENHYYNDGVLWSYNWKNIIGTSLDLSFQGDASPHQASFAVDLSSYARSYSAFSTAGGPLDINLGIADAAGGGSQSVDAITFKNEKTGQTFSPLEYTGPTTVNGTLQWFYGKNVLNPTAVPPANVDVSGLSTLSLDTPQPVSSTSPANAKEWKFIPDTTAIYTLTITDASSSKANIEILNNARQKLYWGAQDSDNKIEQRLYAGKAYVLRAYSGTGTTSFNVTLAKPGSDLNLESSNCNLSAITPSVSVLNTTFDKGTVAYTMNLTEVQPSVNITATKESSGATVTVDGAADSKIINVDTGETKTVNIMVTSQDMVYTKTYSVAITRAASSDAMLSGITAPGCTVVKADDDAYNVTIPELTGNAVITPNKSNAHAEMKIDAVAINSKTVALDNGGSQDVAIHLDSQNGAGHADYVIHVTREKSNNSLLSGMIPSTSKLSPAFNAATLTYNVALPEGTGSVTITPTKAMSVATMTIDGNPATSVNLTPDNGHTATATIVVTSQSGSSHTTYTVNATRANSTNPYLLNITATSGSFNRKFSRTGYSYTLTLPEVTGNGVTTITATQENHNAIVQFISGTTDGTMTLANGESKTVKIKVTAQAGKPYKTYTVVVKRPKSTNNYLKTLSDSLDKLSPVFNRDNTSQKEYSIALGENETSVTIFATQQEPHATLKIDGKTVTSKTFTLAATGAKKDVKITVRSQAGKTNTYTVHITRAKSTNAFLSSITIKPLGYPLNPAFSADMLEYTIQLPANVSKVTLSAAKQSGYATMLFDNRKATSKTVSVLPDSYTDVYIKVTAQDGTTWKTYHVHITRGAGV